MAGISNRGILPEQNIAPTSLHPTPEAGGWYGTNETGLTYYYAII